MADDLPIESQISDKRKNTRTCRICGQSLNNNKTKIGNYCKEHNMPMVRNLYIQRAKLHGIRIDTLDSQCDAVTVNIEYEMNKIIRIHKKLLEECKKDGKLPEEFIATHKKINQVAQSVQKLYSYINKIKGGESDGIK